MSAMIRIAALSSVVILALAGGCQMTKATEKKVDAAADCPEVCSRYRDCFDSNYSVDACATRCKDRASADNDFYRNVNTCEACISDRSCGGATFSCAGECSSVVP